MAIDNYNQPDVAVNRMKAETARTAAETAKTAAETAQSTAETWAKAAGVKNHYADYATFQPLAAGLADGDYMVLVDEAQGNKTTIYTVSGGSASYVGPLTASGLRVINTQTSTSYTLVATDAGKVITMDNASASTLTVPPNSSVAFAIGEEIDVIRLGAGSVTLTPGSGVTISAAALGVSPQYGRATLIKIGTNTWVASGDLT